MAETIETEELEGLCREICREMVPNWDMGAGPRPGPGATTRNTRRKGRKRGKIGRTNEGRERGRGGVDRGEGKGKIRTPYSKTINNQRKQMS